MIELGIKIEDIGFNSIWKISSKEEIIKEN